MEVTHYLFDAMYEHEDAAPVVFTVLFGSGLCVDDFGYSPIGADADCGVNTVDETYRIG